jgi:hypothetical protein
VLARDYSAIKLERRNLAPVLNLAHALMFGGRTAKAKALYLDTKGKKIGDDTREQDFR